MARIQGYPRFKALLDSGLPAAGYKLYSYLAGTSTPEPTYTDQTEATENTNPVILDGSGEAAIWLKPGTAYKLVLKTDADVDVWTVDAVHTAEGGYFTTLSVTGAATMATISVTGQITSTVSTGTPPFVVASTTKVTNLNADNLDGGDWQNIPDDDAGAATLQPESGGDVANKLILKGRRATGGADPAGGSVRIEPDDANGGNGAGGDIELAPGTPAGTGALGKEIYEAPDGKGGQWIRGLSSEEVTLNTGAAATDSTGNLLPANSIIEAVTIRLTEAITTAANYTVGDSAQAARFIGTQTTLTLGHTAIGLLHHNPANASNDLGPVQSAAAKVRITCNAAPGAGKVRVNVWYRQFVAPTS